MTPAAREAAALYARLCPLVTYTLRTRVLTELLLLLPGGTMWWNGTNYTPKSERIGPGVHRLRFEVTP